MNINSYTLNPSVTVEDLKQHGFLSFTNTYFLRKKLHNKIVADVTISKTTYNVSLMVIDKDSKKPYADFYNNQDTNADKTLQAVKESLDTFLHKLCEENILTIKE